MAFNTNTQYQTPNPEMDLYSLLNGGPEESTSAAAGQQQRRLWVKTRSKAWWEHVSSPDYPDEEFRKAFRMGRATFDMICHGHQEGHHPPPGHPRAPARRRVHLAPGDRGGPAGGPGASAWGLHLPQAHPRVLRRHPGPSGIPGVGGAIYTTHIPIIAPKVSAAAYFNKRHTERNEKTTYSVTLQGVVEPNGVFIDICVGWPGSMTDEHVLQKSVLCQRALGGALADTWVVGNSAFPLTDWLLVPYAHQNLTWTQHAFNEKVGEVQEVAREAFMRLKARWSCLRKRMEMKLLDLPVVLWACCVLRG
ncbi:hypothetical protein SASPL_109760 [Salvia splendens]|uniref:DDE Tnp4 domain-containing protein n=1 Tax=Salvia splendens TaxID=180675 RepID=A0A8X8YFG9_SALSN|nr:hypothetical protein SASPL_109760 [Salvia splendens]